MLTQTLLELNCLSKGCSKRGVGRPSLFLLLPLELPTLDLHFSKKQRMRIPRMNFFALELLVIIPMSSTLSLAQLEIAS